jgi:hypothetical protein
MDFAFLPQRQALAVSYFSGVEPGAGRRRGAARQPLGGLRGIAREHLFHPTNGGDHGRKPHGGEGK